MTQPTNTPTPAPAHQHSTRAAQKPHMHLVQYSDAIKATRDFRLAVHAVASTGDVFSRVLASIAHCEPHHEDMNIRPDIKANLALLSEVAKLVSSTHQLIGDCLWREMETPLQRDLDEVNREILKVCTANNQTLSTLRPKLDKANQRLAKLNAKSARSSTSEVHDMAQQVKMDVQSIEAEVHALEQRNATVGDGLAEHRLPRIIECASKVVAGTMTGFHNLNQATTMLAEHATSSASRSLSAGAAVARELVRLLNKHPSSSTLSMPGPIHREARSPIYSVISTSVIFGIGPIPEDAIHLA